MGPGPALFGSLFLRPPRGCPSHSAGAWRYRTPATCTFFWVAEVGGGPYELCERCLRGLCGWADTEGLDVPWKDANASYEEARRRYTEPITTSKALSAMSLEEEGRVYEEAYLT